MELLGLLSLLLHITAGILSLIAGPVAIFYNFKNARNHRLAGKIFFYAMLIICVTAVAGFLKRPDQLFFQFLLGISVIVLASVLRGVRAVQLMKGGTVKRLDYGYTIALSLFGLWMVGMAVWHYFQETHIAFSILFAVFGTGALVDVRINLRHYTRALTIDYLDWYRLHVSSMLGAFTASTTAFTVNAAHFLPWYLQWFGPLLLLLPLQVYYGRKIKGWKTAAGSGSREQVPVRIG
ncbi:MAG: hypothetical protein EP344_19240 [Bacteroidetes bacterium]|nr:MAG: hypothetical protein EP344_19240 [Bacteroidota bacterium]